MTTTYTVLPGYCTGENDSYSVDGEELKNLLVEELDHCYHEDLINARTLDDLLAMGEHYEGSAEEGLLPLFAFDITRRGCLQSTLRVRVESTS